MRGTEVSVLLVFKRSGCVDVCHRLTVPAGVFVAPRIQHGKLPRSFKCELRHFFIVDQAQQTQRTPKLPLREEERMQRKRDWPRIRS